MNRSDTSLVKKTGHFNLLTTARLRGSAGIGSVRNEQVRALTEPSAVAADVSVNASLNTYIRHEALCRASQIVGHARLDKVILIVRGVVQV
jgi:hypothetical protein